MNQAVWLKRLIIFAIFLTMVVIALGAYTRLTDAGLGCPDWPGCYGRLVVPQSPERVEAANTAFPERPLETDKAWIEMIHRYFASILGLVVLIIAWLSYRVHQTNPNQPSKLPLFIVGLVIFQGMLGMWTVTLGLFPTVVMGHLLGGFTTLTLLFLLAMIAYNPLPFKTHALAYRMLTLSYIGIAILVIQIALGGWTAANYAATICTDLPICQAGWQQHLNWTSAFKLWGHGVTDYEFATHLKPDAKLTIHISHRIGAIITTLYLTGLLAWILFKLRDTSFRSISLAAMFLLALQVVLGISNVVFQLPLLVAVAHNGVGVLLLLAMVALTYGLHQAKVK